MTISAQTSTKNSKYNNELKSNLAKLMAAEDITVVHQAIATAAFNCKDRILHLPTWENVSDDLFNMLISHEIGHALHTPESYGDKTIHPEFNQCPSDYINIVEDARIERLVKAKYPGVVRAFLNGYRELMQRPSFKVDDVNALGLIDRLNLHFKGGSMVGAQFADIEQQFVTKIENVVTFQDACSLSVEIYEFVKNHTDEQTEQEPNQGEGNGQPGEEDESDDLFDKPGEGSSFPQEDSEDEDSDGDTEEDENDQPGDESDQAGDESDQESDEDGSESDDSDGDEDGKSSTTLDENEEDSAADEDSTTSGKGENGSDEETEESAEEDDNEGTTSSKQGGKTSNIPSNGKILEALTSDLFDGAISDLDKVMNENDVPVSCQIPDFKLEDWFVPWKEVHGIIDTFYTKKESSYDDHSKHKVNTLANYDKFISDNSKIVNYLAKEFEMKKAAEAHKNTSVAKTGKLNISKVYKYQVSEDIFLRKNVIKDGKNHGLMLLIDWSGSMNGNIDDAIHQVINLAMFAKRVGIPFEVYGFGAQGSYSETRTEGQLHDLHLGREMLRQYLSNTMTTTDFKNAVINLLTIAGRFGGSSYYGQGSIPREEHMGGTPLNENLLRIGKFIENFKAKNSIQKVNLAILTDGASSMIDGYYSCKYGSDLYPNRARKYSIQDKRTHMSYEIDSRNAQRETNSLLEMIRERHSVNVIGFYICGTTRDLKYAVSAYCVPDGNNWSYSYLEKETWAEFRKLYNKQKFLAADVSGFNEYFIIPGKKEKEIKEMSGDMTNAQLKSAFTKKLNQSKESRVVLSKFIDLVA